MAENLNVETFRNGDFIPKAETSNEWRYAADNKEPVSIPKNRTGYN